MKNIYEYINLSKKERQAHIDLKSPCIERGGNSIMFRGLLAHFLNTNIPKGRILCCHACHNDECSNPLHLYWGTDKENIDDAFEVGTKQKSKKIKKEPFLRISESTKLKRIHHYNKIDKKRGYIALLSRWWGVKESTAKRFIERHCK